MIKNPNENSRNTPTPTMPQPTGPYMFKAKLMLFGIE
jgi:hypothetical protein